MTIAYAIPKVISLTVHKCYYEIQVDAGRIVGLCTCGRWIDYVEIVKRINAEVKP